jgi:hypothetical protein
LRPHALGEQAAGQGEGLDRLDRLLSPVRW